MSSPGYSMLDDVAIYIYERAKDTPNVRVTVTIDEILDHFFEEDPDFDRDQMYSELDHGREGIIDILYYYDDDVLSVKYNRYMTTNGPELSDFEIIVED